VTEPNNDLVRKISSSGQVTTLAGVPGRSGSVPGALPSTLAYPWGITLDAMGDLYITTCDGVMVITAP
jgi:hypothetical protein